VIKLDTEQNAAGETGAERRAMDMLKGAKVVVIGDRDGIPGPAIEECVRSAGAEVVFSSTECFV
jgi:glycine/sarcosine/betaine reductase complex component A